MTFEYGDAYGQRQPGSFETRDPPERFSSYYPEGSDENPSPGRDGHQRTSPLGKDHDRMTAGKEHADTSGIPPELLAEITERVKRELVEHLRQTGSIDDQNQARDTPLRKKTSRNGFTSSYGRSNPSRADSSPPPPQPSKTSYGYPMDSRRSSATSPLERGSGVRFTDREPKSRPAPDRSFSSIELSTIDLKWGELFDRDGNSTKRLGQFLRGLANHIIDDYSPKKSIVVTPDKLARYYTTYAVDDEPHPLLSIFRAQSNEQISQLYQDLGCQHFLVQTEPHKEPTIPALTPVGFAHFMGIAILAYPNQEAKRLENVVLDCPIDADGEMIDGKPERLPKQISRHLLPANQDRQSKKLLDNAILDFLDNLETGSRKKSIASPPLSRHSSTSPSKPRVEVHQEKPPPTRLERERKPYSGTPSGSVASEEGFKIERERNPYTAQPGNGKVHENLSVNNRSGSTRANSSSERTEEPYAHHHGTQNTMNSAYVPPPRTTRSPPLKMPGRYSEPIDINAKYGVPPQTFNPPTGNTPFPPPPPPIDIRDTRRERGYSTQGRSPEDDISFVTGDFNSPRQAEQWDRYQESRANADYHVPYERGSAHIDPRETRGAEDWYRDSPPKSAGFHSSRWY
ncbi:hypothetical protein BJ875DRAFT_483213 [Amylocarpus encephaloides]|uniref:DUF7514 domain-containing protein n=1 Tax=Amylocarpus encephaloides TaxID=45428 RepID=A0A9P8C7W5_9HELO|nr:hypothetical protein BJ875DRAFT_483213 [Amylocarpus encephaloides]